MSLIQSASTSRFDSQVNSLLSNASASQSALSKASLKLAQGLKRAIQSGARASDQIEVMFDRGQEARKAQMLQLNESHQEISDRMELSRGSRDLDLPKGHTLPYNLPALDDLGSSAHNLAAQCMQVAFWNEHVAEVDSFANRDVSLIGVPSASPHVLADDFSLAEVVSHLPRSKPITIKFQMPSQAGSKGAKISAYKNSFVLVKKGADTSSRPSLGWGSNTSKVESADPFEVINRRWKQLVAACAASA